MDRLLKRQLRKTGLQPSNLPQDLHGWQTFLDAVDRSYEENKQARYLLERSLDISSREMQALYDDLKRSSESENRRLAMAVEASADAIWITDARGTIDYVNPAFTEITGWTADEVLGKPSRILRSHEAHQEAYTALSAAVRAGVAWQGRLRESRKPPADDPSDRQTYWSWTTVAPIRADDDQLVGYVTIQRDITADVEKEQELERARVAALEATAAKSRFLANMSHEIRTPMNGILGMLEMLCQTDLSFEQREHVETAFGAAESLLKIINQILDLSKIEAGKMVIERVPFDVLAVIDDVIRFFAITAREKGLSLQTRLPAGLPPRLIGDPVRLRQVLSNIVGNALKFTAHGGVTVTVTSETEAGTTRVRCEVADTGIGISADAVDSLFRPFEQADTSTTRRFGGTGLGLNIARQLVELMGGGIGVDSRPGEGATFWFVLPFRQPEKLPERKPMGAPADSRARLAGHILLVEDNPINRKVAATMLRRLGLTLDSAANGREALTMLERGDYDAVLMDCQMPVMDGFETVRRLRMREAEIGNGHLPVIAMTANAMSDDRAACMKAGMDDYMAKPVRFSTLERHLDRWLNG